MALCVTTLQVAEWLDDMGQGQFELAERSHWSFPKQQI